ncbi:hypothetical protein ACLB2K_005594 [Fragaria x ananassa]
MANNKGWIFLFSVWLFVYNLAMLDFHATSAQENITVPAIYIFGDSLVDVGTNSYLPKCKARADMPHNGIDYPGSKATGRFSNGHNVADFLAQFLGYKESPPPFLSLLNKKKQIPKRRIPTKGVNFASGGSGLLDDTGKLLWGNVVSFGKQVQQFRTVRNNISESWSAGGLANISKSMFIISVGSNDMFELFAANKYNLTKKTEQDFLSRLISSYETHLRDLFKLGARKFGIIGVPAIGCCPVQRKLSETGGCLEAMNAYSHLFFTSLQVLLKELSSECKGMLYSLGDTYTMTNAIMEKPLPLGLVEVAKACCGTGKLNAELRCDQDSNLCENRHGYLFWDQYHSSQAASGMLAMYLFGGAPFMVSPMSFSQLAVA